MEQKQIHAKLFIGFEATSEMNMYLSDNIVWKQMQVEKPEGMLEKIRYREKEYVGRYILTQMAPTELFKKQEQEIYTKLLDLCPKINTKKLKAVVFPQSFIS